MNIKIDLLCDYATLILLGTLSVYADRLPLRCLYYTLGDPDISYPHTDHETISSNFLVVLALPIAAACILLCIILYSPISIIKRERLYYVHDWMIALVQAFVLQNIIVNTIKPTCGRLRPDFMARLTIASQGQALPTWSESCNLTNAQLREGRLSFPSGHSSTIFASMTIVSFAIHVTLSGLLKRQFRFLTLCISILPQLLASYVAISRVFDYWHHVSDILAGSIIGVIVAWLVLYIHHDLTLHHRGVHTDKELQPIQDP